jgi:hypothetical protein
MGFLSGLFKSKGPTRKELIDEAVSLLVQTLTKPSEFFRGLVLAEGQTPDSALAEWYAVMTSAMTYAMIASLGSREKISPLLDAFQPSFVRSLSPGCREVFLKIANARAADYIKGIDAAVSSGDVPQTIALSSLMARRVTGHYDLAPEGEPPRSNLKLALMGLPVFKGPDIITVTVLWKLVVGEITAAKKLFGNLQQQVPELFSGPVT